MNGDSKKSTKKKIIGAVIVVVVAILAIVAVKLFGPDPMPVDWSKVQYIPSNVVLLEAGAEHNPSTENVALVRYNEDEKPDDSDWKVLQFSDMHLTQADDRNEIIELLESECRILILHEILVFGRCKDNTFLLIVKKKRQKNRTCAFFLYSFVCF